MSDLQTGLDAARQRQDNVVALIDGKVLDQVPVDLYIPPDALEVILEAFEGPLDLLLYLIRRQNLDILDIKVAEITEQYLRYIDLMKALKLNLAGEYLLMAAMLAEIKSRLLLPPVESEDEEEDPRAELVRRLQEYERVKSAADVIEALPRQERDFFPAHAVAPDLRLVQPPPTVTLQELLLALSAVLKRADFDRRHAVQTGGLSVRERMSDILGRLGAERDFVALDALVAPGEGRAGVIVTVLAILELVREALLELTQVKAYSPVYVRAAQASRGPSQ